MKLNCFDGFWSDIIATSLRQYWPIRCTLTISYTLHNECYATTLDSTELRCTLQKRKDIYFRKKLKTAHLFYVLLILWNMAYLARYTALDHEFGDGKDNFFIFFFLISQSEKYSWKRLWKLSAFISWQMATKVECLHFAPLVTPKKYIKGTGSPDGLGFCWLVRIDKGLNKNHARFLNLLDAPPT